MPAAVYVSILVAVNFECRWKFRISFWALRNRVSGGSISVFSFFFFSTVPREAQEWPANMRSTNARCLPKRHAPRAHTRLGFVSEEPLPPSLALRLTPSLGSSAWSTADACTAFERPHGTTSRGQVRERQRSTAQPHSSCICVFPCTLQPENGAPSFSVDCCSILLMRVNALRISWGMSTTHARNHFAGR